MTYRRPDGEVDDTVAFVLELKYLKKSKTNFDEVTVRKLLRDPSCKASVQEALTQIDREKYTDFFFESDKKTLKSEYTTIKTIIYKLGIAFSRNICEIEATSESTTRSWRNRYEKEEINNNNNIYI